MDLNWLLLCPLVANICFSVMQDEKEKMVCKPLRFDGKICMSCPSTKICPSKRLSWDTCFRYVKQHDKAGDLRLKKNYKDCTSLDQELAMVLAASSSESHFSHDDGIQSETRHDSNNLTEHKHELNAGILGKAGMEPIMVNNQTTSSPEYPDEQPGTELELPEEKLPSKTQRRDYGGKDDHSSRNKEVQTNPEANDSSDERVNMQSNVENKTSSLPYITPVKIYFTIIPATPATPAPNMTSHRSTTTRESTRVSTTSTSSTSTSADIGPSPMASSSSSDPTLVQGMNDTQHLNYLSQESSLEENGTLITDAVSSSGLNGSSKGHIEIDGSSSPESTQGVGRGEGDDFNSGEMDIDDQLDIELSNTASSFSHLVQDNSSSPHYMDQTVKFEMALIDYSLWIICPLTAIIVFSCCCKIKLKARCNPMTYCPDSFWYLCKMDDIKDEDSDQEEESPV